MSGTRRLALVCTALTMVVLGASSAFALPTMIRLGYTDCASCHLSPQGGGLLNVYGRGIDQAQSLRGGEYKPSTTGLSRALTLGGHVTQDVRSVMQEQETWAPGRPGAALFRPRLMYRNVTTLGDRVRLSATVTSESLSNPRPALSYDPVARPSSPFVNTALVHVHLSQSVEVAAGRDQLPSGVNVPDLALFIKSRNRLGYYDTPTQAKATWNAKRVHVTPFAYTGGTNEPSGDRETGGGTLAEVDVFGRQKTVVGVSLLRGAASNGDRRMVGVYTRLGFGSWGILAEHDMTDRTRALPLSAAFQQRASFGQVFWAAREWLVASVVGERLRVDSPFGERLTAGKLELVARLAGQATIGVNTRLQRNDVTGAYSRSVGVQVALKTGR